VDKLSASGRALGRPFKTLLKAPFKTLSLATVLTVPFLLQTVTVTGVVAYLSWLSGQRSMDQLAQQLMNAVSDRTTQELRTLLGTPRLINLSTTNALTLKQLRADQSLWPHFWQQRNWFEGQEVWVSAMYFGSVQGEFTGLGFQADNTWQMSRSGADTGQRFTTYRVSPQGMPGDRLQIGKAYDPRQRPWYKAAINQTQPRWSAIYPDFKEQRLKITLAQRVQPPEGEMLGVVGADFVLNHLHDTLRRLPDLKQGQVLILDRAGHLVAANSARGGSQLRLARDHGQPLIRSIADSIEQQGLLALQSPQLVEIRDRQLGGIFTKITPYRDAFGLDWLIVVALPESDFVSEIYGNYWRTAGVSLGALLVTLGLSWLTGRWLTRPIQTLSQASQRLASGDFESLVPPQGSREIQILAQNFNQMSQALKLSQAQLETYAQSLETKVEARTLELVSEVKAREQTLQQLREAQDFLIEAEKLAALGQLVASIAHEMNTPLGAICSATQSALTIVDQDLGNLPRVLQRLPESLQQQFWQLCTLANQPEIHRLSSLQRRQVRRSLLHQLEATNISDSAWVADTLVEMNLIQTREAGAIQAAIAPFLPLLYHPNSQEILECADRFTSLRRSLQTTDLASAQASRVVQALNNYARRDGDGQPVFTDVVETLEIALTLYYNKIKRGVTVVKRYAELPNILAYPDALTQIWGNLINNALHSMDYQGEIQIQTEWVEHAAVQGSILDSHPIAPPYIRVRITDSGPGIPEALQARIFEPFFTTKPRGQGTGLGLTITQRLLTKHGASLTCDSQPGQTQFEVCLPIAPTTSP
jgi:signal transduction histidine kinase